MQLIVAAVGKGKKSAEAELVAHYLKQTRWNITLKELPDAPSNMAVDARQAREAAAIEALLQGGRLIALDASGTQVSSPELSKLITTAQEHGAKRLVFAIGGQDGLAPSLLAKAQAKIAFGRVTWPHQLLRAMLAEQLYRAYTISIGHPYHLGH